MTFEQYQRRAVYRVQVFSFAIALDLGLPPPQIRRIDKKGPRNPDRCRLAAELRRQRSAGLTRHTVREKAAARINDPTGLAIRVDFSQMLQS